MTSSESLCPIPTDTLADTAAARLRVAIISGQLAPGERLVEPILAAQMGISRSPVREALKQLEGEGLVRRQANRGSHVWDPTQADVDEILSLRVMIECLAAEWTIHKLQDEDFARLDEIIARQQELMRTQDYVGLLDQDRAFHEYICQRAGHSRLVEWWRQIISQWQVLMCRRLRHRPETVTTTIIEDHRLILESLKVRDLDGLQRLHRAINQRVGEQAKSALRT